MRAVCTGFETELVEFNGENNHVHLLVNFPPKVALAKLVNSLEAGQQPQGVSSRRRRQEFRFVSTSDSRTARFKALLGPDGPPITPALKGAALAAFR
jgi:REP element-mobilizing transposase RayT